MQASARLDAAALFEEDFETYATHGEFAAAWSRIGTPGHLLDTARGRDSTRSLKLVPPSSGNGTSNRWYVDLPMPVTPSNERPVVFGFDFYLDTPGSRVFWSPDWQLVDLRGYSGGSFGKGDLTGLVGLGVVPSGAAHVDSHHPGYFQGRVISTLLESSSYFTLNDFPQVSRRSAGWHRLEARIGASQVEFQVNGRRAAVVPRGVAAPVTSIVLGADTRSSWPYWVDNTRVEQVPEPGTVGFLFLALMAIGSARDLWRAHSVD